MVPQDQQVEVASPGMMSDEPVLDFEFVINTFTTETGFSRRLAARSNAVPWWKIRRKNPPAQAENDVPQPHDLLEFGFTKTNPCCIRVS